MKLKSFSGEAVGIRSWIDKHREAFGAFGYRSNDLKCCAYCKSFARPRDGYGECHNDDNARAFLTAGDADAKSSFTRDDSIHVEMTGVCQNFERKIG